MIEVNSKIKALVEEKAQAVCKMLGVKNDKFNQDMNAYAVQAALVAVGVTMPKGKDDAETLNKMKEVLMVLKKGGNASALRQAIDAKPVEDEKSMEIAAELLKL